jgi:hypothetical protein
MIAQPSGTWNRFSRRVRVVLSLALRLAVARARRHVLPHAKGHDMRITRILLAAGAVLLAVTTDAAAQIQAGRWTGMAFININGGLQPASREFTESLTFSIYDETAAFTGRHEVEGGPVFDISGGVRVWRNLAVGLGYTRVKDSTDVNLDGAVPHPLFFSRPRQAAVRAPGLSHRESAVHLQAVWIQPVIERFDVALSAGPSFFTVRQQAVSAVDISEVGAPFTAVNAAVRTVELEESVVGFNVGVDLAYIVYRNVGAGFFMRYTGASVDFDRAAPAASFSRDAGGFQAGGGLRLRF